jgi:HD-GYP domain-containing protein (c-di-GMP phosphodiesterase class II)
LTTVDGPSPLQYDRGHRAPAVLGEERAGDFVIRKLIDVMRLRDPDLADHAQRTAEIATAIGGRLGCSLETLDRLYSAGQLHDIGKLGISEAILWKPTGLSRSEWRVIRSHPEEGHRLVADCVHREIAAAVLYHHERMDGDGYPFGIDGHTLPPAVRVVQVADAFDAMTSERPYQPALPADVAVAEIRRCSGTQFDPEVVDALTRLFRDRDPDEPVTRAGPPGRAPIDDGLEPWRSGEPAVVRFRDRPA